MGQVIHKIAIGETQQLPVYAREKYSRNCLQVQTGEQYHIWCDNGQRWIDLFIPATPAGYHNPVANLAGQRLKGAKCFCLCGAYNNEDKNAFAIGSDATVVITEDGILSFFANDVPGFDWNNWGKIMVRVSRLK